MEIASPSPGKTWTIVLLRRTVLLAGNILKCFFFYVVRMPLASAVWIVAVSFYVFMHLFYVALGCILDKGSRKRSDKTW